MDADCFDDLNEFGAELDDPIAELEQDLYHRLIETPGSNLDDPDRGLGLEDMLSGAYDPLLASRIEAELLKDDRVHAVTASITQVADGEYRVQIDVEPAGSLTVTVTPNGVTRVVG